MRCRSTSRARHLVAGVALATLVGACAGGARVGSPAPSSGPPAVVPPATSAATSGPTTAAPGADPDGEGAGTSSPVGSGEGTAGLEVGVPWPDAPDHGLGDRNFPGLGAPGLDTVHYDVTLRYDRTGNALVGVLALDLRTTEQLDELSLDAGAELRIGKVELDGNPVGSEHRLDELIVRPSAPLAAGSAHRLDVQWSVNPEPFSSPIGFDIGWFPTEGGSYVLDEPNGLHHWMPANDHPTDKATWAITVDVPEGVTAVANGSLAEHRRDGGRERWTWSVDEPISTYLVLVVTGDYELIDGASPEGVPLSHAVLRSAADDPQVVSALDGTGEMVDHLAALFGPYPFRSYGLVIADSDPQLAMETQTRSLFSAYGMLGEGVLVHELAHQWFGDSVTLGSWSDTWLNEGFATYAEWLWTEQRGGPSTRDQAQRFLGAPWRSVPADPPITEMFDSSVYFGGALALQALRSEVGDVAFFEILHQWAETRRHATGTTAAFEALAAEVSGQDLTALFAAWLHRTPAPSALPG